MLGSISALLYPCKKLLYYSPSAFEPCWHHSSTCIILFFFWSFKYLMECFNTKNYQIKRLQLLLEGEIELQTTVFSPSWLSKNNLIRQLQINFTIPKLKSTEAYYTVSLEEHINLYEKVPKNVFYHFFRLVL